MIDFLMIATRTGKRGVIEIYPKFISKKSKDLMIRGSDFYAIWLEERGLWSTEEQDALQLFKHVWIHTFGIGALCAAKVCDFDEKEVSEMLTESLIGMMMVVKSGAKERYNIKPVKMGECDEKESDL